MDTSLSLCLLLIACSCAHSHAVFFALTLSAVSILPLLRQRSDRKFLYDIVANIRNSIDVGKLQQHCPYVVALFTPSSHSPSLARLIYAHVFCLSVAATVRYELIHITTILCLICLFRFAMCLFSSCQCSVSVHSSQSHTLILCLLHSSCHLFVSHVVST